ncbi:hypothetical protein SCALM49S_06609 [Streptomyces californicus]
MSRTYAGARLRRLREERGLSQAELARMLAISPSYLNQMEHDSRPLTVPVLLRLTEVFGVDPGFFSERDTTRVLAVAGGAGRRGGRGTGLGRRTLRAGLAAAGGGEGAARPRSAQPGADGPARGGRRAAGRRQRPAALPARGDPRFLDRRQNYRHEADLAAEELAGEIGVRPGEVVRALAARLTERHGVRLATAAEQPGARSGAAPRPSRRRHPPDHAPAGGRRAAAPLRSGRPGCCICRAGSGRASRRSGWRRSSRCWSTATRSTGWPRRTTPRAPRPGRWPGSGWPTTSPVRWSSRYRAFHAAAEEVRYDIERLTDRFGLGYETVCHRLSTLQRPRLRGVPFSFVRVDRAGNMSKRQSATGFHFSRRGRHLPPVERVRGVRRAGADPRPDRGDAGRAALSVDGAGGDPAPGRLGASRARRSRSGWGARSGTPGGWSTPTGSTWTTPRPRRRSGWSPGSASASTARSGRCRRWGSRWPSTRTAARSCRTRWRGRPRRCTDPVEPTAARAPGPVRGARAGAAPHRAARVRSSAGRSCRRRRSPCRGRPRRRRSRRRTPSRSPIRRRPSR